MSELDPSAPPALFARRSALLFGGALLAGLGALAIFAAVDRSRVTELERWEQITAVGDKVYYPLPNPRPNPPKAIATLDGRELVPWDYNEIHPRDSHMHPVGKDAASGLTIYSTPEALPPPEKAPAGTKFYYVKTGPNDYLRVHAPEVP